MRQASSSNRRNVSVGKAAALLRAAAEHPEGLSVSSLAREAELPRATALRMIEALEAERLLARVRDRDLVLLGPGLFELATLGDADRPLVEAAREPMRTLVEATGEAVTLAVLRGDRIVGIDEIPSPHEIGPMTWIGRSWSLNRTASGRIASGEVPAGEVAVSVDEVEEGLASIAAGVPLATHAGAFVTVSGPSYRFDATARETAGPLLLGACAEIADAVGA